MDSSYGEDLDDCDPKELLVPLHYQTAEVIKEEDYWAPLSAETFESPMTAISEKAQQAKLKLGVTPDDVNEIDKTFDEAPKYKQKSYFVLAGAIKIVE